MMTRHHYYIATTVLAAAFLLLALPGLAASEPSRCPDTWQAWVLEVPNERRGITYYVHVDAADWMHDYISVRSPLKDPYNLALFLESLSCIDSNEIDEDTKKSHADEIFHLLLDDFRP